MPPLLRTPRDGPVQNAGNSCTIVLVESSSSRSKKPPWVGTPRVVTSSLGGQCRGCLNLVADGNRTSAGRSPADFLPTALTVRTTSWFRDSVNLLQWTWCRDKTAFRRFKGEYWENDKALEEKNWNKLLRERIHEREEKQWLQVIHEKPKLRTYIHTLKHKLKQEQYLLVRDRKGVPELTKLRTGTNRLRIEKGRWEKLLPEERTCVFCDSKAIEDEKHFMLFCPTYEGVRQKLWTQLERLFSYPVRI